jgi:3-methylcrotonyl-CoA carboxylase beta subunit
VKKHIRAQDIAAENRLPVLYLVDCGGANLNQMEEVFYDENHFGGTFYRQCRMSAQGIPQLAAVFGECTAGGAYIPALCDEFVMVQDNASIHLGGPQIVRAAISEVVDRSDLGGAELHTRRSGVSDHMAPSEQAALGRLRDMVGALSYDQPIVAKRHPIREPLFEPAEIPGIVGTDLSRPFDQREVIARIVDGSAFHEFKPEWGDTICCGFAHVEGLPVGIIANNGVLFSEACLKATHFIELCDQRGVPILFLQNTTGFMVGSEAELGGISKHSAKLVYAMSNTRVPRITVVTGSSYGAGNYGMSGRGFRPHFMFMWPNARLGGMNPDVGSSVLMDLRRGSISRNPASDEELANHEAELRAMFEEKSDPYFCTARLFDDGIIDPRDTRRVLGICLAVVAMRPEIRPVRPVYRM